VRVTSLDPALGGGCAVITADLSDQLIILDAETRYELARTEEIFALMENQIRRYHPSLVIVEYDAQQKGIGNDDRLAAMGDRYGFRVQPHLTRGQKSDEVFGVASMDQSFMKGEIRIPWGDKETQHRMTPLVHQLKAWRPDIKTKFLTQDLVMALWFIWMHWMKIRRRHVEPPAPAWRPSFLWSYR